MQVFSNFDGNTFIYNGRKYVKNFIVMKSGADNITVYNAYDSKMQLLPATHYSQVKVNNATLGSQAALMDELAPMVFSKVVYSDGTLPNGLISINDVTVSGGTLNVEAGAVWRLDGVVLSNANDFVHTISPVTSGMSRIDIVVAQGDGTITVIEGVENPTIAQQPVTPPNTILITTINVGEVIAQGGIITGEDYVTKSEKLMYGIGGTGIMPNLNVTNRCNYYFAGSITGMQGFNFSPTFTKYVGQQFILTNAQLTPVTLYNNHSAGVFKLKMIANEDYNLHPSASAIFQLNNLNEMIHISDAVKQTLMAVTANGSVTQTPITVYSGDIQTTISSDRITFADQSSPSYSHLQANSGATGSVNIQLPAQSGTLALSSDVSSVAAALPNKADLVAGLVPSNQLPSYVDDIIEVTSYAALPITGETGKIYITIDNNKQYRWTGTVYIQITNGLIGSTSDVPEGSNLYYTDTRARAAVISNSITNGDTTHAPSSDAVYDALNAKANDSDVVKLTTAQSVAGEKTFTNDIIASVVKNSTPTLGAISMGDISNPGANTRNTTGSMAAWSTTNANSASTGNIHTFRSNVGGTLADRAGVRKDGRTFGTAATELNDFVTKNQMELAVADVITQEQLDETVEGLESQIADISVPTLTSQLTNDGDGTSEYVTFNGLDSYIPKREKAVKDHTSTGENGGVIDKFKIDSTNYNILSDEVNTTIEIVGFVIDEDFEAYSGQMFAIRNSQENDILFRNNAETADYKFYLTPETDFILKPRETIVLRLDATMTKMEQVVAGASGGDVPTLQEVLESGNTVTSDEIFHTFAKFVESNQGHSISIESSDEGTAVLSLKGSEGFESIRMDSNGDLVIGSAVVARELQLRGPSNTAVIKASSLSSPRNLEVPDASGTIALESYVNSQISAATVNLWDDRGAFSASGGAYPTTGGSGTAGAVLKGDTWTISVAGTLPTGQVVEVGDVIRALIDTPGNTQANWAIQQNNIGYTAENSANKQNDLTASSTKYPTVDAVNVGLAAKANTSDVVNLTTAQTITGSKVFSSPIRVASIQNPSPTYGTLALGASTQPVLVVRNSADATAAFRVNNASPTSTGEIFQAQANTVTVAGIRKDGRTFGTAATELNDFATLAQVPRQIGDLYGNASNVGTTETDLYSYSITAANGLTANGQKYEANYEGIFTADCKAEFRAYYGGVKIFENLNPNTFAGDTSKSWEISIRILRTSTTTARAYVSVKCAASGPAFSEMGSKQTDLTGLNFATTNILKITGKSDTASGNITAKMGNIVWHPAAFLPQPE